MAGISSLQGEHQVAQRFRNTTLPLRSASRSALPSSEATLKSLACCWRLGLMRSSSLAGSTAAAAGTTTQTSKATTMRQTGDHMAPRVYMGGDGPHAFGPL